MCDDKWGMLTAEITGFTCLMMYSVISGFSLKLLLKFITACKGNTILDVSGLFDDQRFILISLVYKHKNVDDCQKP